MVDCGIKGKTTNEKQNKSNGNDILWKTNDELYSASMLEQIYKISKEHLLHHVTIADNIIAAIKMQKNILLIYYKIKHIETLRLEVNTLHGIMKIKFLFLIKYPDKVDWLSVRKTSICTKIKNIADKNVNDIQLIPVVRFNNENKYFYEIAWIVKIGKDINIAISFKHIKNKYLPSAIYLDIHDAHKLVAYINIIAIV